MKIKVIITDNDDKEIAKSLKNYLKYVKNYEVEDEDYTVEKLMKEIPETPLNQVKEKFLIILNGVSRDGERILWAEKFPNDPFSFPICNLLLGVIFDSRFYNGNENRFLSRSLFVGYLSQEFIREHFGIDINYIQLPCVSLSEKLDKGLKEVKIEDNKKNKLWKSMKESMTDAFKLHGTGQNKR